MRENASLALIHPVEASALVRQGVVRGFWIGEMHPMDRFSPKPEVTLAQDGETGPAFKYPLRSKISERERSYRSRQESSPWRST